MIFRFLALFVALMSTGYSAEVIELKHPLVQHKLTLMRKPDTSVNEFQRLLKEIGNALAYEVTADLPAGSCEIETPLQKMEAPTIEGKKLCLVSIMRAGNGLLEGMRDFIPSARVGHVGLYRDPETKQPVKYYFRMPKNMEERDVIVLDPMLATAGTAIAAVNMIKEHKPRSIKFAALVSAPEGIKRFHSVHPDVALYTVVVDDRLNENAYILPGLGDAGDRIYGTK